MASAPALASAEILRVPWWKRVSSYMPSVIWGAILVASTALAVRQSVHLGESMGFTGFGKESFAQWLALIDICTAVMGAGAIYAWRKGHRGWSIAVGLFAALCVVTSMTNQVGFAAWERFGSVAQREAEAKAAADAKATQLALIKQQIDWNNKTSDPKVEPPPRIKSRVGLEAYKTAEAVAAAARKETLASTERLIEKAGEFDPTKVRASVGDVHAQALSKLTRGTFGAEDIALWLAVAYSILIILAKPISGGMLVISWPGGSAPAGARASADRASLDTALPLKADAQPAAQPAPELPVLPTAPPTVAVAQDHLAPEPAVAVLRPEVQDQPAASAEPLDAESHSVELDRLGAPAAMIEVLNALDPKATTAAADEPETDWKSVV